MGLLKKAGRRIEKLFAWVIAVVVVIAVILAAVWIAAELGVIP